MRDVVLVATEFLADDVHAGNEPLEDEHLRVERQVEALARLAGDGVLVAQDESPGHRRVVEGVGAHWIKRVLTHASRTGNLPAACRDVIGHRRRRLRPQLGEPDAGQRVAAPGDDAGRGQRLGQQAAFAAHLDLETLAFCELGAAVTIASIDPVIGALRAGVFNNALWPDFSKIPHPDVPVVKYRALIEDVEQRVGDLWVTPVAVNHTVPTAGFIVHDGSTGVVYSGDTGPTEALWQAARGLRGLRAVIVECAFPNRLGPLAQVAKHMTPALIQRELDKLPPDVPVWIFHVKPQFHEEVAEELVRIGGARVSILEQDRTYSI
ncbi:MAG: hypothetical protein DMD99_12100 [Candidatus Rokuibacteriota bacterium]|nr:MAG: hypothetical protein DMD99_12100 [Candidatus Rokubacteria bacterium]